MHRPNILILYTDQQRWDALGANGNRDIHTPNLDRLAAQGANFDHYFVQNPVCMPSRLSFLTGQYPSTLGVTHMGVPVPEDTVTLPWLLSPYGYTCANIGKLHFLPHANRDHRIPHPAYGFDHLEISDEPGPYEDAYRAWVRRKAPDQLDKISLGLPPSTAIWYKTMGLDDPVFHPLQEDGGGRSDFKGAVAFPGDEAYTHTAFVGEQTMDFLRRQQSGQPFLCIAGFYSPHAPWVVPQRFLDQYDPASLDLPDFPPEIEDQRSVAPFGDDQLRSARHGYYAMITEVDEWVGRILDTLDDQGLADNTLVVFTSDHGEWLGEHLRYGKSYPGHDPVSRVPLLARGPGIPAGVTVHHVVEAVDVLPSLLELAGIQIPPHLQGRSLGPLVYGADSHGKDAALMESTGWKSLRTADYRYIAHADGRECLYDLHAEWSEYRDVAADPDRATALADMRHRLVQRLIEMERPNERVWTY